MEIFIIITESEAEKSITHWWSEYKLAQPLWKTGWYQLLSSKADILLDPEILLLLNRYACICISRNTYKTCVRAQTGNGSNVYQ